MKFVVDVVLGDTQLNGNVILRYSSVYHDDVMNLGNGLLCGDGDWLSPTGVVFQTIPGTFEFSIPFFFTILYEGAFSPSMITMSSWISLRLRMLARWLVLSILSETTVAQCLIISNRKITKVTNFKHAV